MSEAAAVPTLPPLRSKHTANFPNILTDLGISVLVTTYQAGRLVVLRADSGTLNTHFRAFPKPMGLATTGGRLALGTAWEIHEYHDAPAVARQLEPAGKHDACFLPRSAVTTGDIQIHEMAWAGDELWFVNTRFSCLCTRSPVYSFEPRWRPRFVTAYAAEDRCHLNGLGLRDGRVRYVTALGTSDEPGGWRAIKKDGGVLIDVASNEAVLTGLSMPHSPRWYSDRLWVLESGNGGFGFVEPSDGKYREVCRLPGFTRGLDFAGPLAFVGLSQVRESAVFSGIAIAERPLDERCCGVWVVSLQTGAPIAFVRFEEAVQEIFAVQVLPGRHFLDLINDDPEVLSNSFLVPDSTLDEVPSPMRFPTGDKGPPAVAAGG